MKMICGKSFLREVLPLDIEFGKKIPKGSTHKHHIFMKKYKLVHAIIFLNIVLLLLHHVAHAKSSKA
jgi:hypothetical protein